MRKSYKIKYPVPPALLALYTWRNGTANQSADEFAAYFATLDVGNQNTLWPDRTQTPLAYGYRTTNFFPEIGAFMPLCDATEVYREAQQHSFWAANFWPIFHDDSLLLDFDPKSKTYGQVFIWSPSLDISEPESYYDSLEKMFTTYLTATKNGLTPYGSELEPNFSNYWKLAAQLNPTSTYWQ